LFAGDYDATLQCMADGMTSFNFSESAFPTDIARREVDNPELFYPFRDDGLLLWEAIQRFAAEYVDLYYRTDQDVAGDVEIQNWAREIGAQDCGRIPGFPAALASRAALAETIGHIIFLCTAYHSCIHFKQYEYAGLVPNMPYAAYAPAPTDKKTPFAADDFMKYLPGFRAAYSQTWTFYLTNFRANQLGRYRMPLRRPSSREMERARSSMSVCCPV
jgi:arachidonate 15-lipoxygenase